MHSSQRGDQLVRVQVHTPERLSREEKELFEKLAVIEGKEKGSFDRIKDLFT